MVRVCAEESSVAIESSYIPGYFPMKISRKSTVSVMPCAMMGTESLRSQRRYISPSMQSIDSVFGHAGQALVDVGKAENNADYDQAQNPCQTSAAEQVCDAIHQVASIDELLSKRSQCPGKQQGERQQLPVPPSTPAKSDRIRPFVRQSDQQRLSYEKLHRLYSDAAQDSDRDRPRPSAIKPGVRRLSNACRDIRSDAQPRTRRYSVLLIFMTWCQ